MSASPPYPPPPQDPPPHGTPSPQVGSPPPPPVRTAITLIWVQLAVGVVGTLLVLVVPSVRESLLAPALDAPGLPSGFEGVLLAIVVVSALVGLLLLAAYCVLAAVFLRRGHRWVRVVILVLASLALFSLVTVVLQAVIFAFLGANLLVPAAPNPVSLVSGVVGVALYAAIVVLLFRPASSRWLGERTAQRRWVAPRR